MKLLDGKKLAAKKLAELKKEIASLTITPGLQAILVGNDPASRLYVGLKEKAAVDLGIYVKKAALPEDALQEQVISVIEAANADSRIHGILLQLPLPNQLDAKAIIACIDPKKDVDGFLPQALVQSPTVRAIVALIKQTHIVLYGKRVALLVNSPVFYQGIENALLVEGLAITDDAKTADIVIVAKGKANFLTPSMVKEGVTVIDVGINMVEDKTIGDSAPGLAKKAFAMTPVPGGVGPLTMAYLFENLVELARKQFHQA